MTEQEMQQTQTRLMPGARRKKARMKPTAVMLMEGERQTLDGLAEDMGRSRSDLIREAVQRVWLKGRGRKVPNETGIAT